MNLNEKQSVITILVSRKVTGQVEVGPWKEELRKVYQRKDGSYYINWKKDRRTILWTVAGFVHIKASKEIQPTNIFEVLQLVKQHPNGGRVDD